MSEEAAFCLLRMQSLTLGHWLVDRLGAGTVDADPSALCCFAHGNAVPAKQ
jgi:hypothetical protein